MSSIFLLPRGDTGGQSRLVALFTCPFLHYRADRDTKQKNALGTATRALRHTGRAEERDEEIARHRRDKIAFARAWRGEEEGPERHGRKEMDFSLISRQRKQSKKWKNEPKGGQLGCFCIKTSVHYFSPRPAGIRRWRGTAGHGRTRHTRNGPERMLIPVIFLSSWFLLTLLQVVDSVRSGLSFSRREEVQIVGQP